MTMQQGENGVQFFNEKHPQNSKFPRVESFYTRNFLVSFSKSNM